MTTSTTPLSDPALAPFLTPTFDTAAYLNTVLPPLSPPTTLSSRRPPAGVPLSELSSTATTLLSTLDLQTARLIANLQSLTDEILRIGPRLGYEVDLLRSDVVAFGESLEATAAAPAPARPSELGKLEMLSCVRERLEEVVKIFGEAMGWSLDAPGEPGAGEPDTRRGEKGGKKAAGPNPTEEILYLVAAEDFGTAREKVAALRKLAQVFEGTVEGPARAAVVEALAARVEEAMAAKGRTAVVEAKPKERPEKVEEAQQGWGGGYGLIGQLSRMRGIS